MRGAPDGPAGGMFSPMRWWAIGLMGLALLGAPGRPARAERPAPSVSSGSDARYPLHAQRDGRTWVYHGDRFSAVVARDGSVRFHDHHVAVRPGRLYTALVHGPRVAEQNQAEVLTREQEPAMPAYVPDAVGRPSDQPGAALDRMGEPNPPTALRPPLQPPLAAGVVHFDVTDELLRHHGQDPYDLQKADFLAATEGFRSELAARYEEDTNKIALGHFPDSLDAIWADPGMTVEQKRETLVALYRETADDYYGQCARNVIVLFMQSHPAARVPEVLAAQ
jgi:hypothetical protein